MQIVRFFQKVLKKGKRLACPADCPKPLYEGLMLRCWEYKPDERPSWDEIIDIIRELSNACDDTEVRFPQAEDLSSSDESSVEFSVPSHSTYVFHSGTEGSDFVDGYSQPALDSMSPLLPPKKPLPPCPDDADHVDEQTGFVGPDEGTFERIPYISKRSLYLVKSLKSSAFAENPPGVSNVTMGSWMDPKSKENVQILVVAL